MGPPNDDGIKTRVGFVLRLELDSAVAAVATTAFGCADATFRHGGVPRGRGLLPLGVGGVPVLHGRGSSHEQSPHPIGEPLARCVGGGVVGGDGDVVVDGDDGAGQLDGLLAGAAVRDVRSVDWVGPYSGSVVRS